MTNRWSAERAAAARASDMMREASCRRLLATARNPQARRGANPAARTDPVWRRAFGGLAALVRARRAAPEPPYPLNRRTRAPDP